jgi:putative Ca2+/H+ antiporter (TMEM165/GDT1 family)
MKALKAFGRVWYELVIGDDWKIAAAVTLALAILTGLMHADLMSEHLLTAVGAALLVAAFTVSLLIDVRTARTDRSHEPTGK